MSRGIGRTQQAILDALQLESPGGDEIWTTAELASHINRSPRQVTRAVRSLQERGLVHVFHGTLRMIEELQGFRPWSKTKSRLTDRPVSGLMIVDMEKAKAEHKRLTLLTGGAVGIKGMF